MLENDSMVQMVPDPTVGRGAPGVLGRVAADLQDVLVRIGTPAEVASLAPFGDGHSGVTYRVDLRGDMGEQAAVLRLSAAGARIAGPADIGRQGRIMAALGAAGAAVPPVLACDSNPAVDGRAFCLTALVEGTTWEEAAASSSHVDVARAAIDALHSVQRVPVQSTGIGDEDPATPESDLARWSGLLQRGAPELQATSASLVDALAARLPDPAPPVLVHGDYHYGNLIFRDGKVAAIVDWEIAQLGDPLLDVGCLAVATLRRRYAPEPNPTGSVEIALSELLELAGVDGDRAPWFLALTCLKYSAILVYNLALHRSGKRVDHVYEELVGTARGLLADGETLLRAGVAAVDDGVGAAA
jgi:aminoglycoside phosphotransferase (APT) family kinase protein